MNFFDKKPWLPYFWLSLLCFALYLPGIFTIPMDDRDSAHFAQATRQMIETGNYFQIRYQDVTRYQKPPGINWLQALSVKTFSSAKSREVWPYRLPSVIGGWLSVLLLFAFAKRFCGSRVAGIAAASLASTILLSMESHLAVIDSSLLVSMVLMQGALWVIYDQVKSSGKINEVSWKWPALFFVSMAYGFLLKGVTPLVGFLTLFTLSILDKTTAYFKALRWQWGLLFLLLFSTAWLTGVSFAEHSNYLLEMIHRDLAPKLAGGHESHGAPFGTHFILLFITFWPISLFLWPMAVRTWEKRKAPLEKFLLAWILPTWLFFELMPTKLPQYVLPTFPALAILTALAIWNKTAQSTRTTRVLAILWGFFSLIFSAIFIVIPYLLDLPFSFFGVPVLLTIILATAIITAVIWIIKQNFYYAFIALILGNLLSFFPAYQWLLPNLKSVWPSEMIVQSIEKTIPGQINAENPLWVIGYGEPSLVFLLGTHAVKFEDIHNAANDIIKSGYTYPQYAIIDADFEEQFKIFAKKQQLLVISLQTIHTFNYNKGRWITLKLLFLLSV